VWGILIKASFGDEFMLLKTTQDAQIHGRGAVAMPLLFTTRAVYASIDSFIGGAAPWVWEGFTFSGSLAELKKGRNNLQTAANQGNQNTTQAQGIANKAQGIADSEVNLSGGLSPLVSKQLGNEQGQINKAYSGAASAAGRGLAMRGMGVAPSGMDASIKNTAIDDAGRAQTGAVGNAFGVQNSLNNSAYAQPLNALSVANGGVEAGTGAGAALSKAGSTMGDIGAGLTGLAGIGNSLFRPGGMLAPGGLFSKPNNSPAQ
jgi:hypothetical protein